MRIRRLAARYRGLKTSVDSYIHTRYDAPGASMKIVAGSGSVAMAREIPRIFESVRRESLSDGFLGALRGGNRDGRDQSPGTDGPVRFRHPGFPSTGKDCFEPRVRIWNQEMLLSFLCPDLKIVGVDILDDKRADTKNSLHESDFRSSSRRPCRTASR